eukprot:scaffold23491_cov66-Phaeocystis_antarctica.AAC.3
MRVVQVCGRRRAHLRAIGSGSSSDRKRATGSDEQRRMHHPVKVLVDASPFGRHDARLRQRPAELVEQHLP